MNDFLWGTATSGHQVEGDSVFDDWHEHERRFTPAGRACAFTATFEQDLDRAASLGTNAFRFSLEWARLEPEPGRRDPAAIDYYARLLRACRSRGLEPIVTLVHFTLPRWCAGGWLAPATHAAFDAHVRFVAERFGGDASWWVTINEPNVQAGAGYLSGVFPPGRRLRPDLAERCLVALLRAHARAYRALHERVPGARVGIAPHVIAWRPSRLDLLGLAWREGERFDRDVHDAVTRGGRLDVPEARGTADFLGMNYYMALPADLPSFLRFAGLLPRPAREGTSDLGWPIDAAGFEEMLISTHARYGLPLLVTENGVADAADRPRPAFLRDHVQALRRARARGADVRGYLHWSLIDNFEWHEGYGPRFGLFAVDYATQARTPRPSADVYRALIAEGPDLVAHPPRVVQELA